MQQRFVAGFGEYPPASLVQRGSDEWWMEYLAKKLGDRLPQIHKNEQWLDGSPPIPWPDKGGNFQRLQKIANLNYAEVITNARLHRIKLLTFKTAVDASADGDDEVNRIMEGSDATNEYRRALRWAVGLSAGYLITDHKMPEHGSEGGVRISAEHPSQVIVEPNPSDPLRPLAALKIYRDDVADRDVVVLWRPGYQRIAIHPGGSILPHGTARTWRIVPQLWQLSNDLWPLPVDYVPVVELRPEDGKACFEQHIGSMERINHTILQRMILIALQAFRQRGLKGAPKHDQNGKEIDYEDIFESDPGSFWILPAAVELWESGTTDITPVLNAVRDDIKHLGAVSNTPLHLLAPESANESANGSELKREGLVFECEDLITEFRGPMKASMATALRLVALADRADEMSLRPVFADPRRASLTERAESARAAKDAGVPWRTRMEKFVQLDPQEIRDAELQRNEDMLMEGMSLSG
ncbi:phage portal protein [Kocuria sp.]|uniref:phage portal protein n=1 Tax=Kocuria sp. TaxID=1871328 RepID=UPI0026E059C8|nr:phage portal protein [Kocuria sp.]MDO5619281.1 phage portal protein [Kocuria sp.]